jgi:hypothetical protein
MQENCRQTEAKIQRFMSDRLLIEGQDISSATVRVKSHDVALKTEPDIVNEVYALKARRRVDISLQFALTLHLCITAASELAVVNSFSTSETDRLT